MIGDLFTVACRPLGHARLLTLLCGVVAVTSSGCTAFMAPREPIPASPPRPSSNSPVPRELEMMSLPPYTIEPPDILLLNAIKVVPKPPYIVEPFDGLLIRAAGALPDQPIADAFFVDPEGMIDLGPSYGKVKVVGLTIDGAKDAIRKQLSTILEEPEVSVSLAVSSGAQQIVGEHLVGPDGRVNLGNYGSVYVTGLTIEEAKEAIEQQLSLKLEDPQVIVDIFSYNSKKYYIITQGGGFGDNVVQLPITGNETVLDAIAALGGLSQVSSTKIWIARPARNGAECEQILNVNWEDITRGASTATNYQILPGDRVFIADDPLVKFDAVISKITRPFERLFGFTSLGASSIDRVVNFSQVTN
ncbi:Polysaccharide biosynthesis/export protein [Botrimarina colliarenosi]|uniref:Polysaccharide biosynthesis/export protein n=1 Tax=Botrimarina colliarenosi TaxID=2528001 RepID=A0A5C6AIT6_9BACT|nr:polysaccharide biosynthesis/export family protein [Botrimarina colliarenosi]TWT99924.1 Polysaccharide biosynthesis/export protein [Botrimarina colliarenosi]